MPTVTPPPPPPPTPPAATPAPAPTVTVANPPAALAKLASGAMIDARVIAQLAEGGPRGTFQLQTPQGLLTAQTAAPLPPGGALILQVLSAGPQMQLQIAAIDGKPPQMTLGPKGLQGTAQSGQGGKAGAVGGAAARPLAAGAAFTATLLSPMKGAASQAAARATAAAPSATQTAAPSTLLAKTQDAVKGALKGVVKAGMRALTGTGHGVSQGVVQGASKGVGKGAGQAGLGATPATAQAAGKGAATAHGPASGKAVSGASLTLATGTRVPVRVVSVVPGIDAAAQRSSPPVLTPGQQFTGVASGQTTSGHAILRTPAGSMALTPSTQVPEGSAVTLEVTGKPQPPVEGQPRIAVGARDEMLAVRGWPSLAETVAALSEADPAAARQVLAALPRPDSSLAGGMLFFLSALRGGDIRGWLGGGFERALMRLRPGLVGRLNDDFRALGRAADDPAGDWRSLPVPLLTGNGIDQIRLHLRNQGADDDDDPEKVKSRFIVDLSLTKLGRLQLDGLVKEGNRRLDLIIRTGAPMSQEIRDDIRRIFRDANEITGINGRVTFQAAPASFVEIPAAGKTRSGPGGPGGSSGAGSTGGNDGVVV